MENNMKIVFLDRKTIGSDINLERFNEFGEVEFFETSTIDEAKERCADADIVVTNKVLINEKTIGDASRLKLVCVTATGTNNLDKEYLDKRGIEYRNAKNYSTDSVTEHTFALVFYLMKNLSFYDRLTKSGEYSNSGLFTNFEKTFGEIKGKTWGIIGLGNIGRRVAQIATLFGAKVIYYSASGNRQDVPYEYVSFEEILNRSDIISIHAPLSEKTKGLIDYKALSMMKGSAILINVGRGPIVNESDLSRAIDEGLIGGVGIDVMDTEPLPIDSPLMKIKKKENIIITPHNAWASLEARRRLMDITYLNIKEFLK